MTDPSDEALLAAARDGDPQSLETLLVRYQPRVFRFGMKMCGDEEDAKDVLQDTLFAMARGVRDFRGASSLSTWLYTIARSFCIKKRRRPLSAPVQEQSLEAAVAGAGAQVVDPRPGPEENVAGRQIEAALSRAIASLDPIYREVLVLRDIEGLTAPEVAEVIGIRVDSVKSRLHRARLAVREALLPLLRHGPDEPRSGDRQCPDVLTLFSRHLEGEISADLCAQMERHLDDCGHCRDACESLRQTLALCSAEATAAVPERVQASVRQSLQQLLTAKPSR